MLKIYASGKLPVASVRCGVVGYVCRRQVRCVERGHDPKRKSVVVLLEQLKKIAYSMERSSPAWMVKTACTYPQVLRDHAWLRPVPPPQPGVRPRR